MFEQSSIFDPPPFSETAIANNEADFPPEPTFDPRQKQLQAVWRVMRDGRWRTLEQITYEAGYRPSSIGAISARIRDLPDIGFSYQKRKAKDGRLFEYRLTGPTFDRTTA